MKAGQHLTPEGRRARLRDIADAIQSGDGMRELASKWDVSRAAVSAWCASNISADDRRRLADNGITSIGQKRREFNLAARIELVALCRAHGWSFDKIGMAIGAAGPNLWTFSKLHAPDGFQSALNDLLEDEAA